MSKWTTHETFPIKSSDNIADMPKPVRCQNKKVETGFWEDFLFSLQVLGHEWEHSSFVTLAAELSHQSHFSQAS